MGQVDVTFQFDIKMRFCIAIWSFLFHTFSFTAYFTHVTWFQALILLSFA